MNGRFLFLSAQTQTKEEIVEPETSAAADEDDVVEDVAEGDGTTFTESGRDSLERKIFQEVFLLYKEKSSVTFKSDI